MTPAAATVDLIEPVLAPFVDDGWDAGRRPLSDGTLTKDEATLDVRTDPDGAEPGSSLLTITVESGCLEIPDGYKSWDPSPPGDVPTSG